MDRRTVIAVILSLVIWYGWLAIRGTPPVDETTVTGDPANPTADPALSAPDPSPVEAVAVTPPPVPSGLAAEDVTFSACGGAGTLTTDVGGRVRDLRLVEHHAPYHITPLYTWVIGRVTGKIEGPWRPYGEEPGAAVVLSERATALSTGVGPEPSPLVMQVVSNGPDGIELDGVSAEGIEVHKRLVERRHDDVCELDVSVTWKNPGTARYDGELWLSVHDHTPIAGSRYSSQRQPMALVDGSIRYGGALGAGCVRAGTKLSDEMQTIPLGGPVSWFGLSDRYFGFFVLPEHPDLGELRLTRRGTGDDALDGGVLAFAGGLDAGASRTEGFRVYLGPNHTKALELVDPTLGRAVDLGWSAFFGYPLLWLLRKLHALTGNWGLAIILLTFLVKTVFFPLTQRGFQSMQRMQQIQPELAKVKEEYADDPQEMNRRTMEIMRDNKVNPLSGCLPTLVQMPVWIALYNVLLTSVELYHTRFLYLKDLSEPDPYLALPILITALMWFQQQLSTPANLDPIQQQVMRYMPLIFGFMFFGFPSGLAVYVFVNMVLSILQQWWIKRSLATGGPPAVATAS